MKKTRIFNLRGRKVTLTLVDNFDEEFPFQVVQHVAFPEFGPEAAVDIYTSTGDEKARNADFQRYDYAQARKFIKGTLSFFQRQAAPRVLTSAERAKIQRRKEAEEYLNSDSVCQVCVSELRQSFEFEEHLLDRYPNGPTDEERQEYYDFYTDQFESGETWTCPNCSQTWGW